MYAKLQNEQKLLKNFRKMAIDGDVKQPWNDVKFTAISRCCIDSWMYKNCFFRIQKLQRSSRSLESPWNDVRIHGDFQYCLAKKFVCKKVLCVLQEFTLMNQKMLNKFHWLWSPWNGLSYAGYQRTGSVFKSGLFSHKQSNNSGKINWGCPTFLRWQ